MQRMLEKQTERPTCSPCHWQCSWHIATNAHVGEIANQQEVLRKCRQQDSGGQDATGPRLATALHAACRSISGA